MALLGWVLKSPVLKFDRSASHSSLTAACGSRCRTVISFSSTVSACTWPCPAMKKINITSETVSHSNEIFIFIRVAVFLGVSNSNKHLTKALCYIIKLCNTDTTLLLRS